MFVRWLKIGILAIAWVLVVVVAPVVLFVLATGDLPPVP
jgi:hypothetical protein